MIEPPSQSDRADSNSCLSGRGLARDDCDGRPISTWKRERLSPKSKNIDEFTLHWAMMTHDDRSGDGHDASREGEYQPRVSCNRPAQIAGVGIACVTHFTDGLSPS
jgi:hypothetical protein